MNVVPVGERVAATLETEGVLNDVIAAIFALVMVEFVVLGSKGTPTVLTALGSRLVLGIVVGCVVAAAVWYLLEHATLAAENAPQNARLIVRIAALAAYGFAKVAAAGIGIDRSLVSESGMAAVAAAEFAFGNVSLPSREEMEQTRGASP